MSKKTLIIIFIIILVIIIAGLIYWLTLLKEPLTITLVEFNNSRQSGSAVLIPEEKQTRILVNLANARGEQPVYISSGTCLKPFEVKYNLAPLINGQSETMLNLPLKDLLKQLPLAIIIYSPAQILERQTACGDIIK